MYCSSCTLSSSKRRQRQSSVSNEVGDEVMSPSCRSRVELAPPYSRDPNNNIETVMRKLLAALALVVLALAAYLMLWPVPPAYGHVFAFDESGKVLVDLRDPSGASPETTSVTESGDHLYIKSL